MGRGEQGKDEKNTNKYVGEELDREIVRQINVGGFER